jgi:hypothetical protein
MLRWQLSKHNKNRGFCALPSPLSKDIYVNVKLTSIKNWPVGKITTYCFKIIEKIIEITNKLLLAVFDNKNSLV